MVKQAMTTAGAHTSIVAVKHLVAFAIHLPYGGVVLPEDSCHAVRNANIATVPGEGLGEKLVVFPAERDITVCRNLG